MLLKIIPVTLCHNSAPESIQKIIIFSHNNLMKNGQIFFKFSQELYYMMLKQNPVTVCPKSDPVRIQKLKWWPFDDRKRASPENIIIFSHILMKNSPIFFKFSQELYYIMLKRNPVTVCHKSDPVHIQKLKRWPFDDRKRASPENHHFQPYLNEK